MLLIESVLVNVLLWYNFHKNIQYKNELLCFYKLHTETSESLEVKMYIPDVVKVVRVPINFLVTPCNSGRSHFCPNVSEWIPQVEEMHWLLLSGGGTKQMDTSCLGSC